MGLLHNGRMQFGCEGKVLDGRCIGRMVQQRRSYDGQQQRREGAETPFQDGRRPEVVRDIERACKCGVVVRVRVRVRVGEGAPSCPPTGWHRGTTYISHLISLVSHATDITPQRGGVAPPRSLQAFRTPSHTSRARTRPMTYFGYIIGQPSVHTASVPPVRFQK